jgi:hypothetical protein
MYYPPAKRRWLHPKKFSCSDLRARIDRLEFTSYLEVAAVLGLSRDGLPKQMRGARAVSRRTQIILALLEATTLRRAARQVA